MSHFTVLMTLPAGTDLEKLEDEIGARMARYDENVSAEPYHQYEEGGAENHWWVRHVRREAEAHHADAPIDLPRSGPGDNGKVYVSGMGYMTPGAYEVYQRAARADAAGWAERLGEHPDWETVARLYNEKYGHGQAIAEVGDTSDSDTLHYDPENGRAFTWTTYNPDSKWDYWRIGGRWGGYFRAKADAPGIIRGEQGWDSPDEPRGEGIRADGGLKGLLDFETMRGEAAAQAHADYDAWEALCEQTPVAQAWSHFIGLVEAEEITIDQARATYHDQPRIVAAKKAGISSEFGECPVDQFGISREEYVQTARNAAVPGYALVTIEGEWLAPGEMGWFGMSSDEAGTREAYHVEANTYLDALPDDAVIVALDAHI